MTTLPIRRNYKDSDGIRNASIEVREGTTTVFGDEIDAFIITVHHECWTGCQWLPITQSDFAFNIDDAFSRAKSARDQLHLVA
jgi:hypothetical protein